MTVSLFGGTPFFTGKTLIDKVLRAAGHLDPAAQTERRTKVLDLLNASYAQIAKAKDWPWLYREVEMDILPPEENGTISVTQGTTAVTGDLNTVFNVNHLDQELVPTAGDNYTYRITAVPTGQSLTIQGEYVTTTLTDGQYKIGFSRLKLPTDLGQIRSMSIDEIGEIPYVSTQEFRNLKSRDPGQFNRPRIFTVSQYDGDDRGRMDMWPLPDKRYKVTIDYKKKVEPLIDSDDCLPLIPDDAREVLFYMALSQFHSFLKDHQAAAEARRQAEVTFNTMIGNIPVQEQQITMVPGRDYRAMLRRGRRIRERRVTLDD